MDGLECSIFVFYIFFSVTLAPGSYELDQDRDGLPVGAERGRTPQGARPIQPIVLDAQYTEWGQISSAPSGLAIAWFGGFSAV